MSLWDELQAHLARIRALVAATENPRKPDLVRDLATLDGLLRAPGPQMVDRALAVVDRMREVARGGPSTEGPDLGDTLTALRWDLSQLVTTPVAPPPTPIGAGPPGSNLSRIPEWADRVADAIAWIITAWGIMQAGSWLGYDNWLVALSMGAALLTLFPNLVEPFRRFIRGIILELLMTLVSLVEAIGHFIENAIRYYNGNFARMVIEIALVPVALRAIGDFIGYPAVRQITDWLQGVITETRKLLQGAVDGTRALVDQLQGAVEGQLHDLTAWIPKELALWRDDAEKSLHRAFTQAANQVDRLEARVDRNLTDVARFATAQVAGVWVKLDVLEATLHDRIVLTIAERAGAVARRYYLDRLAQAPQEILSELGGALKEGAPLAPLGSTEAGAPWSVIADLVKELPASPPAVPSAAYDAVQEALADLRTYLAGGELAVGPWPTDLLTPPPDTSGGS
jgi:hypothetical protein